MRQALVLTILFCYGLFGIAASTKADYLLPIPRIKLNVVGVIGENSVSHSTHARMMRGVKAYLRDYGILIQIGNLRKVIDPHPYFRRECNNQYCIIDEFFADYYAFGHLRAPMQVLHVISPPVMYEGHWYLGGLALVSSIKRGGFSYSNN